nr:hypothetical protein [Actinomadura sp. CNU-125]
MGRVLNACQVTQPLSRAAPSPRARRTAERRHGADEQVAARGRPVGEGDLRAVGVGGGDLVPVADGHAVGEAPDEFAPGDVERGQSVEAAFDGGEVDGAEAAAARRAAHHRLQAAARAVEVDLELVEDSGGCGPDGDRAAFGAELRRRFVHLDVVPCHGQRARRAQSRDTCADDEYSHVRHPF